MMSEFGGRTMFQAGYGRHCTGIGCPSPDRHGRRRDCGDGAPGRAVPGDTCLVTVDLDTPAAVPVFTVLNRERLRRLASHADVATRVAAWLVRAAAAGRTRVVLPGAQQGLAETLGASRVSVNRALRGLARAGLGHVEPGAVVVLAPELIARRAAGPTAGADRRHGRNRVPRRGSPDGRA
jgi:hypothetical protein